MRKSLSKYLLILFFAGFLSARSAAQTLPSQKPAAALFGPELIAKLETQRAQAAANPARPGGPAVLPSAAPDPGKKFRIKAGTGSPAGGGTQGKLPSRKSLNSFPFTQPRRPR
jgi:hypothetical protein